MPNKRLGKDWERESRKFLEEKFNTKFIFKLTNPERMDWIVFRNSQEGKKIALVESKSTKKPTYYPFENKRRRNQLKKYLEIKKGLEVLGFFCEFYLLIKRQKKIIFQKIKKEEDIKRKY